VDSDDGMIIFFQNEEKQAISLTPIPCRISIEMTAAIVMIKGINRFYSPIILIDEDIGSDDSVVCNQQASGHKGNRDHI